MVLRGDRGGFALPMAILVIGFLTASVMAAFARTGAEVRIVDNQAAQLRAFAVASAGLEEYIARGRTTPASVDFDYGGDTARVTITLMRPGATAKDTSVYLVRSTSKVRGGANRPEGTRTVAQFAYYSVGTLAVGASWTSLSGLIKNGDDGLITGYDACTADAVAGVAVPNGGYEQKGAGEPIHGEPPVDSMGTPEQMATKINIDWESIRDPNSPSVTPDRVICVPGSVGYDANRGPCGTYPTQEEFANPDYWPTIVINGSAPLPKPGWGRGTLIVTGNLSLGGEDKWNGIILVGGMITDNGNGQVEGAVISGLDVKLGEPVGASSKANGEKDYIYNSCDIQSAMAAMARLSQIPNAWADNWSTW